MTAKRSYRIEGVEQRMAARVFRNGHLVREVSDAEAGFLSGRIIFLTKWNREQARAETISTVDAFGTAIEIVDGSGRVTNLITGIAAGR